MRPSLQVREFLDRYQQRLQLEFISREVGLEREIQLSRQAADTFDAADYFNVIRTSSVVLVEGNSDKVSFGNLQTVLARPGTQLRLFGKPEVAGRRRMGVVLARVQSVEAALQTAREASAAVTIEL